MWRKKHHIWLENKTIWLILTKTYSGWAIQSFSNSLYDVQNVLLFNFSITQRNWKRCNSNIVKSRKIILHRNIFSLKISTYLCQKSSRSENYSLKMYVFSTNLLFSFALQQLQCSVASAAIMISGPLCLVLLYVHSKLFWTRPKKPFHYWISHFELCPNLRSCRKQFGRVQNNSKDKVLVPCNKLACLTDRLGGKEAWRPTHFS